MLTMAPMGLFQMRSLFGVLSDIKLEPDFEPSNTSPSSLSIFVETGGTSTAIIVFELPCTLKAYYEHSCYLSHQLHGARGQYLLQVLLTGRRAGRLKGRAWGLRRPWPVQYQTLAIAGQSRTIPKSELRPF